MNVSRPLVLTGFMGAGKSTVGPIVAESLHRDFYDNDERVGLLFGRTPAHIIREDGESAFREIEVSVLAGLIEAPDVVVATGGGIVATDLGRGFLRAVRADIVWLRTTFEEAERRVKLDELNDRPLFDASVRDRFDARQEWYAHTAHYVVDVVGKSATEVAQQIVSQY